MNETRTPNLILLAAGGTGGHVFPAEALARALIRRGFEVELVTDARGQAFGGDLADVAVNRLSAASPGKGIFGKLKAGVVMGRGLIQASTMIKRLRPAAVVGFGGYPSVPAVFAAARAGLPVMLHEQNAVLGRANRMLAPGAKTIATTFTDVAKLAANDRAKVVRTGNPVRPAVAAHRDTPYAAPTTHGSIRVLVTGGSQGAAQFAQVVPAALALLSSDIRARIDISLQARAEDVDATREALGALNLTAFTVERFFTDVPDRLASCHLAITRAGASTIAELTCVGRPAILVPYMHATDDHQTANAEEIVAAGGALPLAQASLEPQSLAITLSTLLADPDQLTAMARASHAWGLPDAAEALADQVEKLIPNDHHPREAAV